MTKTNITRTRPAPGAAPFRPFKSLVGSIFLLLLLGVGVVLGATTSSILISKNESTFVKGDNYSYFSSISYVGQFVAFDSKAANLDLDTADAHNGWDIFLMDRNADGTGDFDETGGVEITLLTRGANADSRYPMLPRKEGLSPEQEQRFVVFQSESDRFDAPNWLPYLEQIKIPPLAPFQGEQWDPGSYQDIFLADLVDLAAYGRVYIYPVSYAVNCATGGQSNGISGSPGPIPISLGNPVHAGAVVYLDDSDTPFVVFESSATNLVPGGTTLYQHIFVRDISKDCGQAGSMMLLSRTTGTGGQASVQANGHSINPVVSSDGRFVAFVSYATNLVLGPDGVHTQVYLLDRDFDNDGTYDELSPANSMKYYLLSSPNGSTPGSGDSFTPTIGETESSIRVAFSSEAANLTAGDVNGRRDIFLAEVQIGQDGYTLRNISTTITGAQSNNLSTAPAISGDGLVVSFTSYANNLVFDDNNYACYDVTGLINCPDVFSRAVDLGAEFIWRSSLTTAGEESQANSGATQLDGSGKYASFVTFSDLTGSGAMDPYQQIYVRDHGNPPGNPIVSPPSWRFLGVEQGQSRRREFTLTFLGELTIGQVRLQTDTTGYRFTIVDDSCSNLTFYESETCSFTVQYAARADDPLGSIHLDNIVIPLPEDPRENLFVALQGRVSSVSYNPLVMMD